MGWSLVAVFVERELAQPRDVAVDVVVPADGFEVECEGLLLVRLQPVIQLLQPTTCRQMRRPLGVQANWVHGLQGSN